MQAVDARLVDWDGVVELVDVVKGSGVGSAEGMERVVFQSVGIGLADVAVAAQAMRRAGGIRL